MIAPDFNQLGLKSNREVAEFWFSYWNGLFPVKDLVLDFSPHNSIVYYNAIADSGAKRTYFDLTNVESNAWNFYDTARHEQVHQLLGEHNYETDHTIHFVLVDGALNYAFHKARGRNDPKLTISFYDLHEDGLAGDSLNIRMLCLAIKRLSRYIKDIALLLQKAEVYANLISQCTKSKQRSYDYQHRYQQALIDQQEVFEHWSNSEKKHKDKVANLELVIKKHKKALIDSQNKFKALNNVNAIWQGAFIALLSCTIWLITK